MSKILSPCVVLGRGKLLLGSCGAGLLREGDELYKQTLSGHDFDNDSGHSNHQREAVKIAKSKCSNGIGEKISRISMH